MKNIKKIKIHYQNIEKKNNIYDINIYPTK